MYQIDLDGSPSIYHGWTVVSHQTGGLRTLTKKEIAWGVVCDVLEKMKNNVLAWNDVVHNFLYKNQYLIPKSLIGFKLCFFGTKYEKDGREVIKYLYWDGNSWESDYHFLDEKFTREFILLYFR